VTDPLAVEWVFGNSARDRKLGDGCSCHCHECHFHWITEELRVAVRPGFLQLVTERCGLEKVEMMPRPSRAVDGRVDRKAFISQQQLAGLHPVLSEGAGLIGADDSRRAQRFNGPKMPDQDISLGQPLRRQRQGQGQGRKQTFRYHR